MAHRAPLSHPLAHASKRPDNHTQRHTGTGPGSPGLPNGPPGATQHPEARRAVTSKGLSTQARLPPRPGTASRSAGKGNCRQPGGQRSHSSTCTCSCARGRSSACAWVPNTTRLNVMPAHGWGAGVAGGGQVKAAMGPNREKNGVSYNDPLLNPSVDHAELIATFKRAEADAAHKRGLINKAAQKGPKAIQAAADTAARADKRRDTFAKKLRALGVTLGG